MAAGAAAAVAAGAAATAAVVVVLVLVRVLHRYLGLPSTGERESERERGNEERSSGNQGNYTEVTREMAAK